MRRSRPFRFAFAFASPFAATLVLALPVARAQTQTPDEPAEGAYTAPAPGPALTFSGYVDVGFAKAQGNGSSFHPQDHRIPADYGVDPFAPAVNSRGEVASTDAGRWDTNGFLPRSVGIGNRASFLLNTVSFDVRYDARSAPVTVFARAQLWPRLTERGSETRVVVEQAFGRITPFESHELSLAIGRFDSVFGIEYLENQANLRTGITPSLLARYTTGTPIGAKLFYRVQIAPLWSAVSLNVAATNSAPFVDALQPPEISLTGVPVASGRVGYELNLPALLVKLGASGMVGPRNDQGDRDAGQRGFGFDGRLYAYGLSLSGEYLHIDQDRGPAADKQTGLGPQVIPSGFHVRGFYAQLAFELPWSSGVLRRVTFYARGEQRHAWFEGFARITVHRVTGGARFDLWDLVALKAEYLHNRESEGAPTVDNDVIAASAVFAF